MRRCIYVEKKCVYLDLVFNRLLGWEGGSSCVVLGDSVHTGPSSAPQQGILIEYNNPTKKSIYFLLTQNLRNGYKSHNNMLSPHSSVGGGKRPSKNTPIPDLFQSC